MKKSQSTQEVFDRIASGWYGYRHHTIFRVELESLLKRWQRGRLLNIGCGHGADFLPFNYPISSPSMGESQSLPRTGLRDEGVFELYGVDFSIEMLRLAQKYARKYDFNPYLVRADIRNLPYCDNSFDYAIAIASYHHIGDKDGRMLAFSELKRILRTGGEAFITVWNHRQPRFWFKRSDTQIPWRTKDDTVYRYYHLFSYGELESLVRRSGLEIIKSFPENSYRFPLKYFSRNICLLLKKI